MHPRLRYLSSLLNDLIEFEKPKTRYKVIKPYLAGTDFGDTKLGRGAVAAVNQKKIPKFTEKLVKNPGVDEKPRVVRESLIRQDNPTKTPYFVDETGGEIRKATGHDYTLPTESYAKIKTRVLMQRHEKDLQKAIEKAGPGEASKKIATRKFVKHQEELSGEKPKFADRGRIREAHLGEMATVRSNLAQAGLEGRAITRSYAKVYGRKLAKGESEDVIREARGRLKTMVESHVKKHSEERQALINSVHGKISEALTAKHLAAGQEVPEEAHLTRATRAYMQVLHEPSERTVDIHKHYGNLADVLNIPHEEVQQLHKKIADLGAETSEGAQQLHKIHLIKSGDVFNPYEFRKANEHVHGVAPMPKVRTDLKSFPTLKKIGIGGAIAAAGIGIGIAHHRKKKREEQELQPMQMSSRTRLILFGKKKAEQRAAFKANEYAQKLIRKANLKAAEDAPKDFKSFKDIPRELVGHPASAQTQIEKGAIYQPDVIKTQVARRKKEALGQIFETHTTEGLKAIQSSATREKGNVGDLIKSTRAIASAKSGFGKGVAVPVGEGEVREEWKSFLSKPMIHIQHATPKIANTGGRGSTALRALGGYIGRDPALLRPTQKRQFNIDVAAIRRDKKTYAAHAKSMKEMGMPIETMGKRRKALAKKIGKWRTQAKAGEILQTHHQSLQQQLEKTQEEAEKGKAYIAMIRAQGGDAPHRVERARLEGYREADTEATRQLKDAKEHWQGKLGEQANAHRAEKRNLKRSINKKVAIGAGAGVTAGGAAGYEVGKEKKKKKEETEFSSVGDSQPLKKIRNRLSPPEDPKPLHDILTGAAEGGVVGPFTEGLFRKLRGDAWESPFAKGAKVFGKNAAIGAGIGAVSTALVGNAISRIARKRQQNKPVEFTVKAELHDSRLYSNMRGMATLESRDERKAAHAKLGKPFKKATIRQAAKSGLLRKPVEMSAINFDAPIPNRTAVTRDRYMKKIRVDDITSAENNYVRSAIGTGAISTLLRKRIGLTAKPAFLVGAGLGIAAQAAVRHQTAKSKDVFGDRPWEAKRVDKAVGQGTILAAGGIATHQIAKGTAPYRAALGKVGRGAKKVGKFVGLFRARGKTIQFDDDFEVTGSGLVEKRQRRAKEAIAIERYGTYAKRATRLARDIKAKVKGEKILDARGREKTKEWDRPWVRNVATGVIIGGTGYAIHGIKKSAEDPETTSDLGGFFERMRNRSASKAAANAAKIHVPGVAKAAEKVKKVTSDVKNEAASAAERTSVFGRINRTIDKYANLSKDPEFVETKAEEGGTTRHYKGSEGYAKTMRKQRSGAEKAAQTAERSAASEIEKAARTKPATTILDWIRRGTKRLSAKGGFITFAEPLPGQYEDDWEDWLRSRPGVAKRSRRQKTIFEKEENKKVVNRAKIGGALILGTAIGATFKRPNRSAIKGLLETARKGA